MRIMELVSDNYIRAYKTFAKGKNDSERLYLRLLLVTDFMADIAADDFAKKNPELIAGVLKLSNIEEYKSAGYGCIEQIDPLLAMAQGLKRDKTLKTPKLLAAKTVEVLNDLK